MSKSDLTWCLVGLVIGLLIAMTTLQAPNFKFDSFHLGQLVGNVIGGVGIMWLIGRIVQRFSKKT